MTILVSRVTIAQATFASVALLASTALGSHTVADRVKDGPAAPTIRESLRDFEQGEIAGDDQVKMDCYARGKALAEQALEKDQGSADAHFALFANWGRMLQTDGWLKNAYHLPALLQELDRTLALEPNHADALAAKGGLYLHLPGFLGGDVERAEWLLRRALDLDPQAPGTRLELADCYLQTNRPAAARSLIVTALRLAREQEKERFVRRAQTLLSEIDSSAQPLNLAGSKPNPPVR